MINGKPIGLPEAIAPTDWEGIAAGTGFRVLYDEDAEEIIPYPSLRDLIDNANSINGIETIGPMGFDAIAGGG